jgi:hypothetical protein
LSLPTSDVDGVEDPANNDCFIWDTLLQAGADHGGTHPPAEGSENFIYGSSCQWSSPRAVTTNFNLKKNPQNDQNEKND